MRLPRLLLARVLLIVSLCIFCTGHCESTEIKIRLIASGRGAEVVVTSLDSDERWLGKVDARAQRRLRVVGKQGKAVSGWLKGHSLSQRISGGGRIYSYMDVEL